LGRARPVSSAGCSTTASTRGAMNLAAQMIVLLGATAAQSVMGIAFRVTRERGKVMPSALGVPVLATCHPSSILRATDAAARKAAMQSLIADLRVAAAYR
jgi:uracil-DNA glycosylase